MPTPFPTQFTTRTPVSTDNHDIRIAKGEARQLSLETDFSLLLAGIPGIPDLTAFINAAVANSNLYAPITGSTQYAPITGSTQYAPITGGNYVSSSALNFDANGNLYFFPVTADPSFSGFVLPSRDTTNLLITGPTGSLVFDPTEKCVKFLHPDNQIWSKLVANSPTDIVTDSDAAYSVLPADGGRVIVLNHNAPVTVTLNAATQSFVQPGFTCRFIQTGTGQVSFVAAGGLTVHSLAGNLKISAQYGAVSLTTVSSGVVVLDGDLTA